MELGVVMTDRRYIGHALGVLLAAAARGWSCRCFLSDTGVFALQDLAFGELPDSVTVAVCELSIERYLADFDHHEIGRPLVIGGQYQDAELVRHCRRVVVF